MLAAVLAELDDKALSPGYRKPHEIRSVKFDPNQWFALVHLRVR